MPTTPRIRPLFAVLALAALFLAPWPAEAGWLADLWANVGFILDPNGVNGSELVSTPTEGLSWDPNGGASMDGEASIDEGCIWDPNGGACRGDR
ncbi:MAG TPA: hypothetical protein VKM72_28415 [Thermoanaerobaculia bacterium]|nr:hypothetical protein [Thermoanaerobaculia bacterium]